jgi:hypothetical protein
VVVRWNVSIMRNGNTRVSVAEPVFASVGGTVAEPAKDYPSKLTGPSGNDRRVFAENIRDNCAQVTVEAAATERPSRSRSNLRAHLDMA